MLALKLVITPVLILLASLCGRRWGETVGGWLVGLPLTSGPVALFLTLDQGPVFAEQAAAGSLAGTAAQACFAFGYFRMAERGTWAAFAAGTLAFMAAGAVLQALDLSHPALLVVALITLSLALAAVPAQKLTLVVVAPPAWDIPARMLVATTLVLCITNGATALGPRLSGLLASFPIFAAVLALFAHHLQGAAAARQALRGLLLGLYGFATFFSVLSWLLARTTIPLAFLGAGLAAMTVQGISFEMIRRSARLR